MKKETLQELFSNKRRLAVVCECGMSFTGGQGYTALESWQTHVYYYTGNGYPKEEHDTYQVKQNSVTRYEATETCSCGWRPVY